MKCMRRIFLGIGITFFQVAIAYAPPNDRSDAPGWKFPSCDASIGSGPHKSGSTRSFYVTMRDGVKIAIDVVLPDDLPDGRRIPTILTMTRYWRSEAGASGTQNKQQDMDKQLL